MLTAFHDFTDLLSGDDPLAQKIYNDLWSNLGDNYAKGGYTDAKVYATAKALARLARTRQRLEAQLDPATCLELLPDREREYGIVVPATATIASRRAALKAAMLAGKAGTLGNVLQALADLLGEDFVAFLPTPRDSAAVYPANPAGNRSNHVKPGHPKGVFCIVESVTVLGVSTVSLRHLDGSVPSEVESPALGETLMIEPDHNVLSERVANLAAGPAPGGGAFWLTASFARPHHAGALVVRGRHPYWVGTKRHSIVQVTEAAARDPEKRSQINDLMARMLRAVSTWSIVSNDGPFQFDLSPIGATPMGDLGS